MSRCRRSSNTGQSLVEFALILPLLLALLFGVVEFGILLSVNIGLTNSASEAARAAWAFQYRPPAGSIGTPDTGTADAQREQAMNEALMARRHPLVQVATVAELNPVYTYQPADPSSNNYRTGDKVRINISYTRPLFFNLIGTSVTLRAASQTRLEPGGQ